MGVRICSPVPSCIIPPRSFYIYIRYNPCEILCSFHLYEYTLKDAFYIYICNLLANFKMLKVLYIYLTQVLVWRFLVLFFVIIFVSFMTIRYQCQYTSLQLGFVRNKSVLVIFYNIFTILIPHTI